MKRTLVMGACLALLGALPAYGQERVRERVRDEEDFIAVPWGVVTYEVGERVITLSTTISRDRLREVTFREGRWPDFASERWQRSVRTVWGERALRRGTDVGRPGE